MKLTEQELRELDRLVGAYPRPVKPERTSYTALKERRRRQLNKSDG